MMVRSGGLFECFYLQPMSSSRGKALATTKFNTSRVNKCPERALLCVLCGLRSMCRESIFSALIKRMIGLLEIKIELFVRHSRFLFWGIRSSRGSCSTSYGHDRIPRQLVNNVIIIKFLPTLVSFCLFCIVCSFQRRPFASTRRQCARRVGMP